MEPRQTVVQQLGDILEALQLARKTGVLTVAYDQADGGVEQGTITFYRGQITQASVGYYQGLDVVELLKTWYNCRIAFLPVPATNNISPLVPPPATSPPTTTHSGWLREHAPYEGRTFPYRICQAESVLPLFPRWGLSRLHRQLFLLIDGQRSIAELARLTGRDLDKIEVLLADLEHANLISQQ